MAALMLSDAEVSTEQFMNFTIQFNYISIDITGSSCDFSVQELVSL